MDKPAECIEYQLLYLNYTTFQVCVTKKKKKQKK